MSNKMALDARNELVTAIHTLASHFENTLYALRDDAEAVTKAKGDIAHALQISAKYNRNGAAAQPSQAPVVQATSEPQTWHDLKADPDAWDAVAAGIKTHEIRLDDRDFAVGDGLRLRKTRYTGHEMRTLGKPLEYIDQPIERIVSHIQRGYGLDPGWCILSFADRASSGATTAQAVRMLTREELNDVALSDQVGWEPGEYIEAVQRKFCAVNAGKRIPASGEIGSV